MNINNIIKLFFQRKRHLVLIKKFYNKVFYAWKNKIDIEWLKKHKTSWEDYLKSMDLEIFDETREVIDKLIRENREKLKKLDVKLGGSANQFLLYFLIRKFKPSIIFETGVAAGHSSRAILKALKINQKGKLYSSDFPYFRIKNAEKYIGILVEEELKHKWHLSIEGDSVNIKEFLKIENTIDFFHYDSDKSYKGKQTTFNLVKKKISQGGIFIFDDIQDDNFFRDIATQNNFNFKVFSFENKYVGLINF
jgi:predicted O-methyltransferase YrrM